jgi:hypothetical protein
MQADNFILQPFIMSTSTYRYKSGDFALQRLREPLKLRFSQRTMQNRVFKASMGETLASWDGADSEQSGIPTKEIIELYRRCVYYVRKYLSEFPR